MIHARAGQFLRLLLCALAEGLAGGLGPVSITTAGEKGERETSCRSHAEILRFLYLNGFTPILDIAADDPGSQHCYRCVGDFLEERLKPALRRRLGADFSEAKWAALSEELADSALNESRALCEQIRGYRQVAQIVGARGEPSLFGYLTRSADATRDLGALGHDAASLLVQIGSLSGHRSHPCTKTRLLLADGIGPQRRPLSAAQFAAFAPEAAPDVALPILAVAADRVTTSLSSVLDCDYGGFFAQSFREPHHEWARGVAAVAGETAPARFVPIPVHPLQLDAIRARLAGPIAAGDIVMETGASIVQRPTISLRTFTPVGRPAEPQVKTSLAILMTSEIRTMSPARSFNAPVLCDLLVKVAARDPVLRGEFRVLPDPAAVAWGRDPDPASVDYRDGFHLGAIFRRNPASLLGEGEIGIPLNALFTPSPVSGAILIAEIMREAGAYSGAKAIAWFRDYTGLVLRVTLGLLARYGISIEAHQQNTDLIFDRSGRLKAVAYRDVSGGIEICEPMLVAQGHDIRPALHPYIRGLTPDIALPIQQTMHTTLVSHLFPAATIIAGSFALESEPLLAVIQGAITANLSAARRRLGQDALRWRRRGSEAGIAALFHEALNTIERRILQEPIETKGLLQMRAAQSHDVAFTAIDNPLVRA